jgi:nucleotide-binding universal stress UspA family protein
MPASTSRSSRYQSAAIAEAKQALQALQQSAARRQPNPAEVVAGDPAQCIVQCEQEFDCDLIVIGKPASLAEDILLGSVTRHVLEESQSDLLISQ